MTDWHLATRVLTGWDVGIAFYLVLTSSVMWRADVAEYPPPCGGAG